MSGQLCEDEGCPQHGIKHVCVNNAQQVLPGVEAPDIWLGGNTQRKHLTGLFDKLLEAVDPEYPRAGIAETPDRAAKAWQEWTRGYTMTPADVLKLFEDGAEGTDEMVVVHDIPVYSHCEHHLAPIFGHCTIGYLPNMRIIGLSKLNRTVDIFARRLQVQERMTNQIAEALMEGLRPLGVGVVMRARHLCMESRGVKQSGTFTTTSKMLGVFRTDAAARAEFLALAHKA